MKLRETSTSSSGSGLKFLLYLFLLLVYITGQIIEEKPPETVKKTKPKNQKNSEKRFNAQQARNVNLGKTFGIFRLRPIHLACISGDFEAVKILLNRGDNVNAYEKENRTPLFLALENGHEVIADFLVAKGANLTHVDKTNANLLHYAAKSNSVKYLKIGLQQSLEINKKARGGYTPLHYAAMGGHKEASIFLKENGADTTARIFYGWTPGDLSKDRTPWIANYLGEVSRSIFVGNKIRLYQAEKIDHSATLNLPPLHQAVMMGDRETFAALLNSDADLNTTDTQKRNILNFMAATGKLDFLDLILVRRNRLNLDMEDINGVPALTKLVLKNRWKEGKLLLKAMASPDAKDIFNNSVLQLTIKKKNQSFAKLLVEKGADIHHQNFFDETVFHLAVENRFLWLVEILLKNGADVNKQDIRGNSPLHLATMSNFFPAAQKIVKNGADIFQKNFKGKTPLDIARENRLKKFCALFANRSEIEGINPAELAPAEALIPGQN